MHYTFIVQIKFEKSMRFLDFALDYSGRKTKMIEVTQENYEKTVLNSNLPVVIEFGAVWCAPCKRLEPELEKLAEQWKDKFILAHINVDQDSDLALQYSVMSVPTVILVKNGEEMERFSGFKPIGKIIEAFESYIL